MIQINLTNPPAEATAWFIYVGTTDWSLFDYPEDNLLLNTPFTFDPADLNISGSGEINVEVFVLLSNGTWGTQEVDDCPVTDGDTYDYNWSAMTLTPTSSGLSPKLSVINAPVQGGELSFSFSGFYPGENVWVAVLGGGGIMVTADASGNGSGSFIDNDAPGSYTLEASDRSGWYTLATFTLGNGQQQLPEISNFNIASTS